MEFGTDVHSYNITDLKRYQSYRVYVAGRSHGGVGVENYEEAMTDEDGRQICKIYFTVCTSSKLYSKVFKFVFCKPFQSIMNVTFEVYMV